MYRSTNVIPCIANIFPLERLPPVLSICPIDSVNPWRSVKKNYEEVHRLIGIIAKDGLNIRGTDDQIQVASHPVYSKLIDDQVGISPILFINEMSVYFKERTRFLFPKTAYKLKDLTITRHDGLTVYTLLILAMYSDSKAVFYRLVSQQQSYVLNAYQRNELSPKMREYTLDYIVGDDDILAYLKIEITPEPLDHRKLGRQLGYYSKWYHKYITYKNHRVPEHSENDTKQCAYIAALYTRGEIPKIIEYCSHVDNVPTGNKAYLLRNILQATRK